MRVLHLIPTLGLGGAEAMLSRLLRDWAAREEGPRSVIACLDSAGFNASLFAFPANLTTGILA